MSPTRHECWQTARACFARALLTALCVLLAGCSAVSLTYDRAPTLLFWWVDSYVDFNPAQAAQARVDFATWHHWHRTRELPRYRALVRDWRQALAGPLDAAQVCAWRAPVVDRMQAAFAEAMPGLVRLAISLDDTQRGRLVKRFARANAELHAEYADGSLSARQDDSRRRSEKFFRRLYGPLNAAQKMRIAARTAETAYDAERWLAERAARQELVLAALTEISRLPVDSPARQDRAEAALTEFSAQFFRSPRAEYQAYRDTLLQRNCRLFAEVHAAATPAQVTRAREKLADWEALLTALMPASG